MADVTISYKGNTIATMDESGSKTLETQGKYCEDNISLDYVKPSVVSLPPNDVNFSDYDGTIVASYSASDFANLTELPANPIHAGLIAQGWNWTLADAQAQVLISGGLEIGQCFKTESGATELDITIVDRGRMNPTLYWNQTAATTIDWGDGNSETFSGTGNKSATHTYSAIGSYTIKMLTSGTLQLGQGTSATALFGGSAAVQVYRAMLKEIRMSENARIGSNGLYLHVCLRAISIPASLGTTLNSNSFYYCAALRFLTIPNGITILGGGVFRNITYSLERISLPKSVATLSSNGFYNDAGFRRVFIPNVTNIPDAFFYGNNVLTNIVIPATVTNIGSQAFYNCTGLAEVHFKPTVPPVVANSNAWTGLPTNCKIYVPRGHLSAYTSAANYPSSTTYTYVEE